jgi:hypothetical protein
MMVAATCIWLFGGNELNGAVIAEWRFEPDTFLLDTSGNGNHLQNGDSSAAAVLDETNVHEGSGSALFSGGQIMQTISTLDLSGYSAVSIAWSQRVPNTTIGILFEHSADKNVNPGGILATVSEPASGVGQPSLNVGGGGQNNDHMSHLTDGTWQTFTMTIDLLASGGGILEVAPGGTDEVINTAPVASGLTLLDDTFFIGARSGVIFGFTGNLDNIVITGIRAIPEPSSAVLGMCGVALAGLMFRRKGYCSTRR